jgi:hypothetical protein
MEYSFDGEFLWNELRVARILVFVMTLHAS